MTKFENLRTVAQLAEANPAFSQASIRWLLFNAKANGLEAAVVRVGRRVLVDIQRFESWLEEHRGK